MPVVRLLRKLKLSKTSLLLLAIPVGWLAMLVGMHDRIIYQRHSYTWSPPQQYWLKQGYNMTRLEFGTDDGDQVTHVLTPMKGDRRIDRIYVVFGGNAMLAWDWLTVEPLRHFRLADTMFVLMDYPGYGASDGTPDQASIGRVAVAALSQAGSYIDARNRGNEIQVNILGHSIGCAAGIQLASLLAERGTAVRHLVLSSPFASIPKMAFMAFPVLKVIPEGLINVFVKKNLWDNHLEANRLASLLNASQVQVDIIHSKQDEIVPFTMGRELAAHMKGAGFVTSFKAVGGGHNQILQSVAFNAWFLEKLTGK